MEAGTSRKGDDRRSYGKGQQAVPQKPRKCPRVQGMVKLQTTRVITGFGE